MDARHYPEGAAIVSLGTIKVISGKVRQGCVPGFIGVGTA
jgi:hypothetical protein